MKVEIKNMTTHTINLMDNEGNIIKTFLPSGEVIRIAEEVRRIEPDISGLPCVSKKFYVDDTTLPEREPGKRYIVSSIVKSYCPGRNDFLVPDTGVHSAVRDENGNIIGVKRFWK